MENKLLIVCVLLQQPQETNSMCNVRLSGQEWKYFCLIVSHFFSCCVKPWQNCNAYFCYGSRIFIRFKNICSFTGFGMIAFFVFLIVLSIGYN